MDSDNPNITNEVFPDWPMANVIIGKLMAEMLGPYLDVSKSNSKINIAVHYLPRNVFHFVPPALRAAFFREYREFALWAHITLGVEHGLAPWENRTEITTSDMTAIKREISERIERYDSAGLSCFKKIFLQFMGVI